MNDNKNEQEPFADLQINMAVLQKFFSFIPNGLAFCKIIIDENGRPIDYVFIEVNDSLERLTGLKRAAILNRRVTDVLPGIQDDPSDWIGKYGKVAITGVGMVFENYAAQLDKWYRVIATCPGKGFFLSIFEDITDRKGLEKENVSLIAELRKALSEIKQLRGILPICASCKKIRDDKGEWMQMEAYIRDHSAADFSHGICPECAKKVYRDLQIDPQL